MLLSHLVHKKRVSQLMSSYQILRVVWTYLSTSDWTKEGVSMAIEGEADQVCMHSGVEGMGLWRRC